MGLVAGSVALILLVVDRLTARGKNLAVIAGKLDTLCGQVDDFEGRLSVVDGLARTVEELVYEWRGVDGNDGYKKIIQDDHRRIDALERHGDIIEAVRKARAEDEQRSGGLHRRKSERDLNNLLPEEREEKP